MFGMRIKLEIATSEHAVAIAALRNATAEKLTAGFGEGVWSGKVSEKGVLFDMRNGTVFVARSRGKIFATLTLLTKKPWAIDRKYFTPVKRPLYLTAMAVAAGRQRAGIGRACMKAVEKIAKQWPEFVRSQETGAQQIEKRAQQVRGAQQKKTRAQSGPADAICLDAYDAAAGAGPFYAKCGFREVGRASYRGTPLVYYEMLL